MVIAGIELLLIQPVIGIDATGGTTSRVPWFAPWAPLGITGQVPSELVIRPATWHLFYLGGLIALFAAAAIAERGRASACSAGRCGGGGTRTWLHRSTHATVGRERAALVALVEHPEEHQICEERREVTYCAYPAYAPWIDRWAKPVEGALAVIPPDERPEGLIIRQRFSSYFEGPTDLPPEFVDRMREGDFIGERTPGSPPILRPGTVWGRGETEGQYELGLALYVAMGAFDFPSRRAEFILSPSESAALKATYLVGIPERFQVRALRNMRPGRRQGFCHASGQARALVAWWIAAQSTPATSAAVERVSMDNPTAYTCTKSTEERRAFPTGSNMPFYPEIQTSLMSRVQFSSAEFHNTAALLDRPQEDIASVVSTRWDELAAPTTTTDSFLPALGIEPHPRSRNRSQRCRKTLRLESVQRSGSRKPISPMRSRVSNACPSDGPTCSPYRAGHQLEPAGLGCRVCCCLRLLASAA